MSLTLHDRFLAPKHSAYAVHCLVVTFAVLAPKRGGRFENRIEQRNVLFV